MEKYSIYRDIAERSGGDVYIGVVGPVRTGKSTFIKKFMDLLVIPNIGDIYSAERAKDELPQSAAGRTIMTTEPKFIPNEAVSVSLGDNANLKVRMIDCVGYIVDGSLGYIEEDSPRMVKTPWSEDAIPFYEAAEIGTKKVINEHSTIGLVVTTDGSITEIERENYVAAEKRVVNELKAINKPFIVLLNSTSPNSEKTQKLRCELENEYKVPVAAVNCEQLTSDDINHIIETVLFEFPLREINIRMPSWIESLGTEHWLDKEIYKSVVENIEGVQKIRQAREFANSLCQCENIESCRIEGMDLGCGNVNLTLSAPEGLFYRILGEESGFEIDDKEDLIELIKNLSEVKTEYDKVSFALHEVKEKGYGIVSPGSDELTLAEPKIVKQGGRFGVKLTASAPSIHIIRYKPKFLKTA